MPGYPSLRTCLPFKPKEVVMVKPSDILTDQWQDTGRHQIKLDSCLLPWKISPGEECDPSIPRFHVRSIIRELMCTPLIPFAIPHSSSYPVSPAHALLGRSRDAITAAIWLLPWKPLHSWSRALQCPSPPLMWRGCQKASLSKAVLGYQQLVAVLCNQIPGLWAITG